MSQVVFEPSTAVTFKLLHQIMLVVPQCLDAALNRENEGSTLGKLLSNITYCL